MRRNALGLLAAVLWGGWAGAQPPAGQPVLGHPLPAAQAPFVQAGVPGAAAARPSELRPFDCNKTELRRAGDRWVILADGALLKDFGPREAEAREALQIIRGLQLTEYGTVGGPAPVMEYWLTAGHAPYAADAGLRVVPIDLNTLQVYEADGQWGLRDGHRVFFTFGANRDDANHALDVIRHYGFTKLGCVGRFAPAMVYFLGSQADQHRPSVPPQQAGAPARPAQPPGQSKGGPPPGVTQTSVPPAAPDGHRRFDPRRVEVKRDKNEWKLMVGRDVLANFGPNQQEAYLAWNTVQHYRFNELVSIGRPTPSFSYFLISGQPPRNTKFGIQTQPFRPEAVLVRNVGGSWMVCEGEKPLVSFGDRLEDARQLAEAIQHFHFEYLCRIGNVDGYGMTFLVRAR